MELVDVELANEQVASHEFLDEGSAMNMLMSAEEI